MEKLYLVLLILVLFAVFGSKTSSSRSGGGVHVKPAAKTPRPNVKPAPQSKLKSAPQPNKDRK